MSSSYLIKLENIGVAFGKKDVLSGLSFKVHKGSKSLIIGPNGCGKTTLLKALISHIPLSKGLVYYSFNAEELNQNLSWLSTSNLGLYDRLTGRENIDFYDSLLKQKSSLREKHFADFSTLKPFQEALETPVYKCSAGMKQILRIFIMLLGPAKILIWDEPFRALDESSRNFLYQLLWHNKDYTIIYTSHIYNNIDHLSLCYEIREGKLVN